MNFHIHIRAKETVYGGNEAEGRATTEKSKRHRMLIAAACLLIGMPTTVLVQ